MKARAKPTAHLTALDRVALQIIHQYPWITSQALADKMGLTRTCGVSLKPQGAGRLGAARGARLYKMGLVERRLVHEGYCYGYCLTTKGEATLTTAVATSFVLTRQP